MKLFYSAATGGFYNSSIHGKNMPEGVVEITQELHDQLMEGQSRGKRIAADASGAPLLIDAPALSDTEVTTRTNAVILEQILDLETKHQPRAMRDMVLRKDKAALQKLDDQIAELRSQLK